MGSIYKRGKTWWIKYYRDGMPMRESTKTDKYNVAKGILKDREGEIAKGVPVTPRVNRTTMDELLDLVLIDYQKNDFDSLATADARIRLHVRPFFKGRRAASITGADINKYIVSRQAEKKRLKDGTERAPKNGTINREVNIIKRAFHLGIEDKLILSKPTFSPLKENNVRKGFFEREQFFAVYNYLPDHLKPVALFAYITGWRSGEIRDLEWPNVEFRAGVVRLDAGTTKSEEGRDFPINAIPELKEVLEKQWEEHKQLRKAGTICPFVFHRKAGKSGGRRKIGDFRKAWATACRKAGVPGRIMHDFRRTAVRNLVRAGVPEKTAMRLTGHKTRSVFDRYDIVDHRDLELATQKLQAYFESSTGTNLGTKAEN